MSGHRALTDNYLADTTVEDPGNAGTITIDRNPAVVELVSADSETRTLADPRASGRVLTLVMKTDVGDIVVTASTAYDENGSTTITFANTGEFVKFVSIPDPASSGDYVWRVTSYDGATGPTINLATVDVDTLSIGGTAVTATAAEINLACDESANIEIVTTTNVLTAAESGKTLILNSATAFVTTLPAKAAGLRFTFIVGATPNTSGNSTIVPNASNDNTIFGEYIVAGLTVPAITEGSINLIASTCSIGDIIHLFCDGTYWYVSGMADVSGSVTFTT